MLLLLSLVTKAKQNEKKTQSHTIRPLRNIIPPCTPVLTFPNCCSSSPMTAETKKGERGWKQDWVRAAALVKNLIKSHQQMRSPQEKKVFNNL